MKTFTCTRDSHGLFDYESTDTKKTEFQLRDTGVLTRNAAGEVALLDDSAVPLQADRLLQINAHNSGNRN